MRNIAIRSIGALCIILLACAFSCGPSSYHTAADAAAKIATGLAAVETVNEDLATQKLIGASATIAVANYVNAATLCNDAFVSQLKALGAVNAATGPQIYSWWTAARNCIQPPLDTMVLVDDAQARARLDAALAAVNAAAQIIDLLLQPYAPAAAPSQSRATGLAQPTGVNYGSDRSDRARARRLESGARLDQRAEGPERNDGRATARLRGLERPGDARCDRGAHRERESASVIRAKCTKVVTPIPLGLNFACAPLPGCDRWLHQGGARRGKNHVAAGVVARKRVFVPRPA
ncbi:MAG: hypothetical protein ABSG52_09690 [Terriglobales bacterium]|jgi:hypothetical protein